MKLSEITADHIHEYQERRMATTQPEREGEYEETLEDVEKNWRALRDLNLSRLAASEPPGEILSAAKDQASNLPAGTGFTAQKSGAP